MQERPETDEDEKKSTDEPPCPRNPLLMASRSQVSQQFAKTIRNANVHTQQQSTIKSVKDTLGTMTAPKKFVLQKKKEERAAKKEADKQAKE